MTIVYIFQKLSWKIQMKKRFDDSEMSGGADRQKFGQAFNNSKQDRQQKIIHKKLRGLDVELLRGEWHRRALGPMQCIELSRHIFNLPPNSKFRFVRKQTNIPAQNHQTREFS